MKKTLTHLLIMLALGVGGGLCVLQSSDRLQAYLASSLVASLEDLWQVRISYQHARANLFNGTLTIVCGSVSSANNNDSFSWSFDRCRVSLFLFTLLTKAKIRLGLEVEKAILTSQIDPKKGTIAFVDHLINDILIQRPGPIDISLHELVIDGAQITLHDAAGKYRFMALVHGNFVLAKSRFRMHHYTWRGNLQAKEIVGWIDQRPLVFASDVYLGFDKDRATKTWIWHVDGRLGFTAEKEHQLFVCGKWDNSLHSRIVVQNKVDRFFAALLPDGKRLRLKARIPYAWLVTQPLLPTMQTTFATHAIAYADIIFGGMHDLAGVLCFDNVTVPWCDQVRLIAQLPGNSWQHLAGTIALQSNARTLLQGTFSIPMADDFLRLECSNAVQLQPWTTAYGKLGPDVIVQPGDASIKLASNASGDLYGSYQIKTNNRLTNKAQKSEGTFLQKGSCWKTEGSAGSYSFALEADTATGYPLLVAASCHRQGQPLLSFVRNIEIPEQLEGRFSFDLCKLLATRYGKQFLRAKNCWFYMQGVQSAHGFVGDLRLEQGGCYFPAYRNMMNQCAVHIDADWSKKIVMLSSGNMGFTHGSIHVPYASMHFSSQGHLQHLFAPIQCADLFFNIDQKCYGSVYGNLLLTTAQASDESPSRIDLSGLLVLGRTLLRGDIAGLFETSGTIDAGFFSKFPLNVSLKISNQRPVRLQTTHLDGYAHLDLGVRYRPSQELLAEPIILGTVQLERSSLKFFDHRLAIEYGKLEFLPNRMSDPLIELSAKNTINRYQIMLHATGSLRNPTVTLESNPELTEEQIVGLLLAGSEHATMQSNVASTLAHSFSALLPYAPVLGRTKSLVQKIMKPFKYVQVAPDFEQEPGKSALKGTMSLALNDQIRAQIEKNLNMQDELYAQIEYLVTDDIYVKAVKDRRGEIGCEVEARFKF